MYFVHLLIIMLISLAGLQAKTSVNENNGGISNILVFSGSLREASLTKKLAKEAGAIAETLGANVRVIELNDYPIPFYNEDEEKVSGMPENAKKIRDYMLESQIILIVSPNYNKSFPAVVKNVLDWTSRSEQADASREAYKGKVFALMSASSGAKGGIKGLPHLKDVVDCIGGTVFEEEFILPFADKSFDEQDNFVNKEEHQRLHTFIETLLND